MCHPLFLRTVTAVSDKPQQRAHNEHTWVVWEIIRYAGELEKRVGTATATKIIKNVKVDHGGHTTNQP